MPLPPSRKDFTGPPPRDVSDLAKITRHHGSYLRRLDPGFLGGTRGTPSPVRGLTASPLIGDDGGGDGADDIQFWDTDQATVSVEGTVTVHLTYEPIENSLVLFWGGDRVLPSQFSRDGQTVIFTNPHLKVGRVVTAYYAYIDEDPEPFDLVVRGTTRNTGGLPVETEAGDFIIVAARWGFGASVDFSADSRLTQISSSPGGRGGIWTGIATDLSALSFTGTVSKCVVVAYVGGAAVVSTSTAVSPPDPTNATPAALSGSAALAVLGQRSSVVPGGLTVVGAPWTLDENSGDAQFSSVRVYHWIDETATTTPVVTAAPGTGGVDEVDAVLITVVGLG